MTALTSRGALAPTTRFPTGAVAHRLPPALHYTLYSTLLVTKNFGFIVFAVAMPVILYVVFSTMFGPEAGGTSWPAMIMVSMAAYGSLGAAMSGGAQLAIERRSGWFRQLTLTVLPSRSFLWAKAAVIMFVVLPALVLVFVAGIVIGGVRAPVTVWLASLSLMWLALIPLTVLGVVLGLWIKAEAVQGCTTLLLLLLAMLGGLWFPTSVMPVMMQYLAYGLPSYWLAELGRYPFLAGAAFPWNGVWVLLAWSVGLTVLGALGYRRAAANSKR